MTRELWRFHGREILWGYTFLVWVLSANPRPGHCIGQRHAKVQL